MGDVLLKLAAGFEPAGTGGLVAVAGTSALSDGIVLGDAESGSGGTGIALTTEPRMRAKPSTPGSVTKADDFYVQEDISTYAMAYPFSGNRAPRPATPDPSGSDFRPDPGYLTLLNAAGLIETGGTAAGVTYQPGVSLPMDSMVWDASSGGGNKLGARSLVQEAGVNSLTIVYEAGAVPVATADVVGAVTPDGFGGFVRDYAFPVPDYGVQASVAPPLTANVGALWTGSEGAQERCFQALTLTINNAIADVQDACKLDGFRRSPTLPRDITVSGTMIVNDLDFDAEYEAMTNSLTSTVTYAFGVGPAAAAQDDPMVRHSWIMSGVRVTSHEAVEIDETGLRGITFDAYLSSDTSGGELSLTFE